MYMSNKKHYYYTLVQLNHTSHAQPLATCMCPCIALLLCGSYPIYCIGGVHAHFLGILRKCASTPSTYYTHSIWCIHVATLQY